MGVIVPRSGDPDHAVGIDPVRRGSTTIASLLGSGKRVLRARQQIYEKWSEMEASPVVSTALTLLVTAALGGHETTGNIVFIEPTADAKNDKRKASIAAEIAGGLGPILNREALTTAYTGAAFGDAYARIYADRRGVIDLCTSEMVRPPLVQPYDQVRRTRRVG